MVSRYLPGFKEYTLGEQGNLTVWPWHGLIGQMLFSNARSDHPQTTTSTRA